MKSDPAISLGIDFGTTNTVVAKSSSPDEVSTIPLGEDPYRSSIHPSVLAFALGKQNKRLKIDTETGARAIDLASHYPDEFRYVQSFKSHVASRSFDGTSIFRQRLDFSDLLSEFLKRSGIVAEVQAVRGPKRIIVGRPVKFHGERPDEGLAIARYSEGFHKAGIEEFDLAFEPVGGAFSFFRSTRQPVCALIADFGGGTSDFVIARFQVAASGVKAQLLSHAGVGIAGDTFDFRIIQNALLEHFGAATTYRTFGKSLPVPRSYYSAFSRWHQLTRLRAPKYLDELKDIRRTAEDPENIDNLIYAITHNKGLSISREVSAAKARLSDYESADLSINLGCTILKKTISRVEFEHWIADDIRQITKTIDDTIARSGVSESEVDQIFLVGGTSFVPAIHSLFLDRFGADRILAGERFSSVAEGLALIGLDENADYWTTE